MIENKIYAGEQKNQLLRYHNAYREGKLLYLTLFGDESEQHKTFTVTIPQFLIIQILFNG